MSWLQEQGCTWNAKTFNVAVRNGHIQVMSWLRDKGCNWNDDTFYKFNEYYDTDINLLKWLDKEGYQWDSRMYNESLSRYRKNISEVSKFLYSRGCTWNAETFNIVAAKSRCPLETFKWIHEQGCTWNAETFNIFLENSYICLLYTSPSPRD